MPESKNKLKPEHIDADGTDLEINRQLTDYIKSNTVRAPIAAQPARTIGKQSIFRRAFEVVSVGALLVVGLVYMRTADFEKYED